MTQIGQETLQCAKCVTGYHGNVQAVKLCNRSLKQTVISPLLATPSVPLRIPRSCRTASRRRCQGTCTPCPSDLEKQLVGVSRATRVSMRGESRCRRFRTDSEQFQVQQLQASDCDASTTSDAEEAVCNTVSADVPLDSVIVWLAVRCLLSFLWCCIGTDATVRNAAAADLGRSGCEEKTGTTVRRTMGKKESGQENQK